MGYSFYNPSENKVFVARNAEFFENDLIDLKASGSVEDLELIQEEDTNPSVDTSLNHEEDDQEIDEPQSDINPIRRSTRTRRPTDRLCLYIDAEEHELGDLASGSEEKKTDMDGAYYIFKALSCSKNRASSNLLGVDYEEYLFSCNGISDLKMKSRNLVSLNYLDEPCDIPKSQVGVMSSSLILYVVDILLMGKTKYSNVTRCKILYEEVFAMKDLVMLHILLESRSTVIEHDKPISTEYAVEEHWRTAVKIFLSIFAILNGYVSGIWLTDEVWKSAQSSCY
ncbi:hypothetical protein Tco_0491678 [Tanacetum coccineum]